jgi:hypothetical protein
MDRHRDDGREGIKLKRKKSERERKVKERKTD